MATYIHKNGPESGSVNLKDYELGISDAAYAYTFISGAKTPIKVKQADNADNIQGIAPSSFFRLDGQDQVVQDTYVTFNDEVNVVTKITCPTFEGTATRAKYADIAENYESDEEYEAGTVLFYGKDTEASIKGKIYLGVVSDKPGYLLNSEPKFKKYVPIVLKGRSPVKIKGDAKRGDLIFVDFKNPGYGMVSTGYSNSLNFIGVALGNSKDGKVEVKF